MDAIGYTVDPVGELAQAGAELVLNLSASPFHVGKAAVPAAHARRARGEARRADRVLNQVGGNDELVFDGGSFAVDARGRVLAALPLFETALEVFDLERRPRGRSTRSRTRRGGAARGRARARDPRLLPQAEPAAGRGGRASRAASTRR